MKNKHTFIQTEKAKSSHFDRTRGDKKQIFFTLILDTLGKRSEKLTALLFFDFEHHLFQKNIEHYSKLQWTADIFLSGILVEF